MSTMLSGAVLDLLIEWLPANDDPERPQIQVATVDEGGRPDIRTVLLSAWAADGFAFNTDSASRKSAQLAANPAVAIEVLWPGFTRQLVVRGMAEPLGTDALAAAFARRSPYLRQLAWQNTHELALLDAGDRRRTWSSFAEDRDPAALPVSPTWAGYLVRPDRLTFWTSDPDGPSHRVEYTVTETGWSEAHLPG